MLRTVVGVGVGLFLCVVVGCGKKKDEDASTNIPPPSWGENICVGRLSIDFSKLEELSKPLDEGAAKDMAEYKKHFGSRAEFFLFPPKDDRLHLVVHLPNAGGKYEDLIESLDDVFNVDVEEMTINPSKRDVKELSRILAVQKVHFKRSGSGIVAATRPDLLDHDVLLKDWHSRFVERSELKDIALAVSLSVPKQAIWDALFDRNVQPPNGYEDAETGCLARIFTITNAYDSTQSAAVILHRDNGQGKLTWLHEHRDEETAAAFENEHAALDIIQSKDISITGILKRSVLRIPHRYTRAGKLHRLEFSLSEKQLDEDEERFEELGEALLCKSVGSFKYNAGRWFTRSLPKGIICKSKDELEAYIKRAFPIIFPYSGRYKEWYYFRPSYKTYMKTHFVDERFHVTVKPIATIGADGKRRPFSGTSVSMQSSRNDDRAFKDPTTYVFPKGTEKAVFEVIAKAYVYDTQGTLNRESKGQWTDMGKWSVFLHELDGRHYVYELNRVGRCLALPFNRKGEQLGADSYGYSRASKYHSEKVNQTVESLKIHISDDHMTEVKREVVVDCPDLSHFTPSSSIKMLNELIDRPTGFYKAFKSVATDCKKEDFTFEVAEDALNKIGPPALMRVKNTITYVDGDGKSRTKKNSLDHRKWWLTDHKDWICSLDGWKSVKGSCTLNVVLKDEIVTMSTKKGSQQHVVKADDGTEITITVRKNHVTISDPARVYRVSGLSAQGFELAKGIRGKTHEFIGIPKTVVVHLLTKTAMWEYPIEFKK